MANNFEEGQGSQRAVMPVMMMMMMMMICLCIPLALGVSISCQVLIIYQHNLLKQELKHCSLRYTH
jgi:hypothetical protein